MIREKSQTITKENISNIDKLYAEYLLERAERAEEAIKRGEYITLEELKKSIDEWEAKYEATHTQRSK